jgi:hypothetical protein
MLALQGLSLEFQYIPVLTEVQGMAALGGGLFFLFSSGILKTLGSRYFLNTHYTFGNYLADSVAEVGIRLVTEGIIRIFPHTVVQILSFTGMVITICMIYINVFHVM